MGPSGKEQSLWPSSSSGSARRTRRCSTLRPRIGVYRGKTIRNVPLNGFSGPDWARRATARYYEQTEPRAYPVESGLALHLTTSLVDREFDPVSSDALPDGKGEGHAFAFVRK